MTFCDKISNIYISIIHHLNLAAQEIEVYILLIRKRHDCKPVLKIKGK